jgi:hypothetical protein
VVVERRNLKAAMSTLARQSTPHPDAPLPMTDAEWRMRLSRSWQSLAAWCHEAKLPWANAALTRSIAEHEIGALQYYVPGLAHS